MAYKTRAHRTEEGGYSMEYGKGTKKLVVRLVKHGKDWRFVEAPKALLGRFNLLDNAKQAFETWASQAYGGPIEDNQLIDSPVNDKGTILETPPDTSKYGPPPPMAGAPVSVAEEDPPPLHTNTDFVGDYDACDPFDPLNYVTIDGYTHVTEIGALRHVWNWVRSRYLMKAEGKDYPVPLESVRRALARHFPNDLDFQLPTPAKRA